MIDGFKIAILDSSCIKRIRSNNNLEFKHQIFTNTGELVFPKYTAQYRSLHFEHYESNGQPLYIRGNIMKYASGLSNLQNFSLKEVLIGFIKLANELEISLLHMKIVKLEWGLNFILPDHIPVNRFIDNILVYKGKLPSKEKIYQEEGSMKIFDLTQQTFKIYNKAAQHGITDMNVVRYEIVIENATLLRRKGIHTIDDIARNRKTVKVLNEMLLSPIEHFIFYDYNISAEAVPNRLKKTLIDYNNPKAWKKLIKSNPELYRKKRVRFAAYVTQLTDIGISWNKLFYNNVKAISTQLTT